MWRKVENKKLAAITGSIIYRRTNLVAKILARFQRLSRCFPSTSETRWHQYGCRAMWMMVGNQRWRPLPGVTGNRLPLPVSQPPLVLKTPHYRPMVGCYHWPYTRKTEWISLRNGIVSYIGMHWPFSVCLRLMQFEHTTIVYPQGAICRGGVGRGRVIDLICSLVLDRNSRPISHTSPFVGQHFPVLPTRALVATNRPLKSERVCYP